MVKVNNQMTLLRILILPREAYHSGIHLAYLLSLNFNGRSAPLAFSTQGAYEHLKKFVYELAYTCFVFFLCVFSNLFDGVVVLHPSINTLKYV